MKLKGEALYNQIKEYLEEEVNDFCTIVKFIHYTKFFEGKKTVSQEEINKLL